MIPRMVASVVFASVLLGTVFLAAQDQQPAAPGREVTVAIVPIDGMRTRVAFMFESMPWMVEAESVSISHVPNGMTIKGSKGTLLGPKQSSPREFDQVELAFSDGKFVSASVTTYAPNNR
jgi:hypothetical protein